MSGRAGACMRRAWPDLPAEPATHQSHFTPLHPPHLFSPPCHLPACLPACLSVCCPAACLPAGRRGKDDKGMVFLMVDDALDITTAK